MRRLLVGAALLIVRYAVLPNTAGSDFSRPNHYPTAVGAYAVGWSAPPE